MRFVVWEDEQGLRHRSVIRDDDPDELAKKCIPQDPPLIHDLDWDEIKRDLHNALVDRGLFDYNDLVHSQNGVTGAIMSVLRSRTIALYKQRR